MQFLDHPVDQFQAAPTKPTDFSSESTCKLLSFTLTIAIYYYSV